MNPRHLFISLFSPLIWRLWPDRQVNALQEFAMIEKDSGLQLIQCQAAVEDPHLAAYLFQHGLEEFYHAELFSETARSLADRHLFDVFLPRERLLSSSAQPDVPGFFAYVQVGEAAVNSDFKVFARSRLSPSLRKTFARAGADEGRHEWQTDRLLFELCGGDNKAMRKVLWRARCRRWLNLAKRFTQSIGALALDVLLTLVYFAGGLIAARPLKDRLKATRAQELRFFVEQVRDFEARQR